jgi:hypothetical protein
VNSDQQELLAQLRKVRLRLSKNMVEEEQLVKQLRELGHEDEGHLYSEHYIPATDRFDV